MSSAPRSAKGVCARRKTSGASIECSYRAVLWRAVQGSALHPAKLQNAPPRAWMSSAPNRRSVRGPCGRANTSFTPMRPHPIHPFPFPKRAVLPLHLDAASFSAPDSQPGSSQLSSPKSQKKASGKNPYVQRHALEAEGRWEREGSGIVKGGEGVCPSGGGGRGRGKERWENERLLVSFGKRRALLRRRRRRHGRRAREE